MYRAPIISRGWGIANAGSNGAESLVDTTLAKLGTIGAYFVPPTAAIHPPSC